MTGLNKTWLDTIERVSWFSDFRLPRLFGARSLAHLLLSVVSIMSELRHDAACRLGYHEWHVWMR